MSQTTASDNSQPLTNDASQRINNPTHVLSHKDRLIGAVGLISTIIGLVAGAFESIAALRKGILSLFGSRALLIIQDNMPAVVGICIAITAIAICLWIHLHFLGAFHRLVRVSRSAGIAILWISGVLLATGCTYYVVPSKPDAVAEIRAEASAFAKELMASRADSGGIRYNRVDSSTDVQVWCTAQAVWAILQKPPGEIGENDAQIIRSHLDYMERMRLPNGEGWGYMEPITWGVTEIAAWVTLAHIASARQDIASKIWQDDIYIPLARIETYLDIIRKRQAQDGGMSPVNSIASPSYLRTYSTLMGVWAMLEAQRLPQLANRITRQYSVSTQNGIRWLLLKYNSNRESAVPNPTRAPQVDSFPGLTAQVLYVMERAKPDYEYILKNDENYELMLTNFITSLELPTLKGFTPLVLRDARNNDRTHDSDRYLSKSPYLVESSTYLWLPWSMAFCASIDLSQLDSEKNRLARNGCELITRRAKDLVIFAKSDPFAYVMAEALFALHLQLHDRQKRIRQHTSSGTKLSAAYQPTRQ